MDVSVMPARPLLRVPAFNATSQLERPALAALVAKLESHRSVQHEMSYHVTGPQKNPAWIDYRAVLEEADDAELLQLLFHEAPVVRVYMLWGIAERCPEQLIYAEYLLADRTTLTAYHGGCVDPTSSETVGPYAAFSLSMSDHPALAPIRLALINSVDAVVGKRMFTSFLANDDEQLTQAMQVAGPARRGELRELLLRQTFAHRSAVRCAIAREILAEGPNEAAALVLGSSTDEASEAILRGLAAGTVPCRQAATVALVLRPATSDAERCALAAGVADELFRALQAVAHRAAEVPRVARIIEVVLRSDPIRFYALMRMLWEYAGDGAAALATYRRVAQWLPVGAATGAQFMGHRAVRQLLFEKLHGCGGPEDAPAFVASLESPIAEEFEAAMRPLVNWRLITQDGLASFRGRTPAIDALVSKGVAALALQGRI